jgi:hypothetical protein
MMDRPRLRRIVLHIGLERTGSTSLQNYWLENRKRLSENSILYPTQNLSFQRNNHIGLVASYLPPQPNDYFMRGISGEKRQVLDTLLREITKSSARTIILSSEHFSSRLRRPQIRELASDFKDFDCTIVVFLRDHLSRFYSTYGTHVASGGCETINEYCDFVLQAESLELRYAEIIQLWEEAFGRRSLEIRRYDTRKNVLAEFFSANGVTPLSTNFLAATKTELLDLFGIRTNRSLGPRRTEALRRANVAVSRLLGSSTALGRTAQYQTGIAVRCVLHLARSIRRLNGVDRDDAWSLDATRLDNLAAVAKADRDQLKERFGVDFST